MANTQTAVEWIEEQIKLIFYVAEASEMNNRFQFIYDKAKQLEFYKIREAYYRGVRDEVQNSGKNFEDFYKETYGSI